MILWNLWVLLILCKTSSTEIIILKYNKTDNNGCTNPLVEVPISSNSIKESFTFCGQYNFRFLREAVLMGLEPNTYLWIMNFEEKNAGLKYHGDYYFFDFKNQNIIPNEWQHLCLAISLNQIKIVLNGEILLNKTINIISSDEQNGKMWFGGFQGSSKWYRDTRLEGLITDINVWNQSLEFQNLITISTRNSPTNTEVLPTPDLFLWSTFEIQLNTSSCVEYLILEENNELFQKNHQQINLIEYLTDFDSSYFLCQAIGGELVVLKNLKELNEVTLLVQQSEKCDGALLGLMKSTGNNVLIDVDGNIAPFVKWGKKQPNGENFQQCVSVWRKAKPFFDDVRCNIEHCFFCKKSDNKLYTLRGKIPINIERKYFARMSKNKSIEIRGVLEKECFWKKGTWHFGEHLTLSKGSEFFPPVGAKIWSNNSILKFTQCNENEFTCHKYGNCISMNKRCDGHPDCPLDGSDENECKMITMKKGYEKKFPSEFFKKVSIAIEIFDIREVNELNMDFTILVKIELKWSDSRITFRNLKASHKNNQLNDEQIDDIWTPELLFPHSNQIRIRAGEKIKSVSDGTVRVHRQGLPQTNELFEIDEDYLYPGNENPISMVNYFLIRLGCKFNLEMYPFDTQKCPIVLLRPSDFHDQFVMDWKETPTIKNIKLAQFDTLKKVEYKNKTGMKWVNVDVILCRNISYYIVSIYIPTFCLFLISFFTLFIDSSHFEANIMVALTGMLVSYTLYQGITSHVPPTSYMKMIDIWLISGLIIPFFIISILIIKDYEFLKEKDQVVDLKKKIGKFSIQFQLSLKLVLKMSQIALPLIVGIGGVVYWIKGLRHYSDACSIN